MREQTRRALIITERAAAAYHADPERMLAETALLGFLREAGS
jgi:hypothetical protein